MTKKLKSKLKIQNQNNERQQTNGHVVMGQSSQK